MSPSFMRAWIKLDYTIKFKIILDKLGGVNVIIFITIPATPLLWMRTSAGFFMSEIYQRYEKPVLNIDQQLELLIKQGLLVKNPKRVLHYLRFIGYHRLSGYFRTFQFQNTSEHIFKKGATFDSIISVYIFDRKLRLLVMDAVERIEVAVRTTISSTMYEKYGPHWYLKPMLFKSSFNHKDLIKTIERETGFKNTKKQNKSCNNYFKNYNKPYLPLVWIRRASTNELR